MAEAHAAADYLTTVAARYLGSAPALTVCVPFDCPIAIVENMAGLVLYRDKQLQVQLFIASPNSEVPAHCHPNVDSYEVFLGGDLHFHLHGKQVLSMEQLQARTEDGMAAMTYQAIRVPPDAMHGAIVGPRGGAFLSIQLWKDGVEPTSVGNDWSGATMGECHQAAVTTSRPV